MTSTADEMQRSVYALNSIAIKYNLKISVYKKDNGCERKYECEKK
jgi:hypothetical protein